MIYFQVVFAYHSITLHCDMSFLYKILHIDDFTNFFCGKTEIFLNKKCKNVSLWLSVNEDDEDYVEMIGDDLFLNISTDTYSLFQYCADCIDKYGLPFSTELNDLILLPKNKTLSFTISVTN